MSKVRIELDHEGIKALLQSAEMQAVLQSAAENCSSRVGGNFQSEVNVLPTRAVAKISAADYKTYRDCLKHNTLVKAIK